MDYKGKEEDRQFILSSGIELDQYLNSWTLMWRLSGLRIPLSPGNLLFALKRFPVDTDPKISEISSGISQLIAGRRQAWWRKIEQEIPMRVNQWKATVEELQENGSFDRTFSYAVRARVVAALLIDQLDTNVTRYTRSLEIFDELLKNLTKQGEFLWESDLLQVFPQAQFPYLYLTGVK